MASGEVTQAGTPGAAQGGNVKLSPTTALPMGTVITNSGRVSATRFPGQAPSTPPFSQRDLIDLDDALKAASEKALVRFSVYIGELGEDAVADARAVLAQAPEPANGALIAVSPNTHDVVVVSGARVADRVNDRVAQLGVTAAIGSFRSGQLIDGLIAALHVVATAAAPS
ncbi:MULTISPECIES: DUF5130 domain-containing protein [Gordonia]|uniref:DUF5130 domain-containing protein n=1 Tax=Gordonia TaxID=2053 RepID=UPI0002EE7DFE|nr:MULTISPECIES: DUF5130 domain-containing protein [Gordonia]MDF3282193.1 DUF5130 domain-containing protein [Gordonia sp. N1V]UZF58393.1 DUF5130 domain-containing protein [Gordonia polyisoprenivorans]